MVTCPAAIVFQHSHPDAGSPFGQGAYDCSASGTGYAFFCLTCVMSPMGMQITFVVVSKRSRAVINVAQKLEHTVQPVYHATVKTTQNIVEIPTVQEQMICPKFPRLRLWQCSTPIRSCLFFSAHLPARCTACPFVSAVFVDSARMTDTS